jgi:23S rRNA pseudouridine955/2504/2580 synthase
MDLIFSSTIDSTRIDKYLRNVFPNITQGFIEKSLRIGDIKLNKSKVKASHYLTNGDVISISDFCLKIIQNQSKTHKNITHEQYFPDQKLLKLLEKSIIYEDQNLIAINKPQGLACQAGSGIPHSVDRLITHLCGQNIKIVHRLDKDTSGVLILAKNLEYAQLLTKLFRERKVKKTYFSLCQQMTKNIDGFDLKMGNSLITKGSLKINLPLGKGFFNNEEKTIVDFENGVEAESFIEFIKEKNNLFLFKINPITGRKHQIRAHLKYLGFPICGDKKYNYFNLGNHFQNLCLQANSIEIKDLGLSLNVEKPDWINLV